MSAAPEAARIFRNCRGALGLSAAGLAACLHSGRGGRMIRYWESGDCAIPGPVWVALRFILRDAGEAELAAAIDDLLR